jgi:hypothetical protein
VEPLVLIRFYKVFKGELYAFLRLESFNVLELDEGFSWLGGVLNFEAELTPCLVVFYKLESQVLVVDSAYLLNFEHSLNHLSHCELVPDIVQFNLSVLIQFRNFKDLPCLLLN